MRWDGWNSMQIFKLIYDYIYTHIHIHMYVHVLVAAMMIFWSPVFRCILTYMCESAAKRAVSCLGSSLFSSLALNCYSVSSGLWTHTVYSCSRPKTIDQGPTSWPRRPLLPDLNSSDKEEQRRNAMWVPDLAKQTNHAIFPAWQDFQSCQSRLMAMEGFDSSQKA